MGVVSGFVLGSDFAAKLGGKWSQTRSPKLKLCAPWRSSSEELPKTIHANSSSGITKNVYFQPGRSWQQWVHVFGPTVGKYPQKSLIKYDRVDGSSPACFSTVFPQGVDPCSWRVPVHARLRPYRSQAVLKHSSDRGSCLRALASRH